MFMIVECWWLALSVKIDQRLFIAFTVVVVWGYGSKHGKRFMMVFKKGV